MSDPADTEIAARRVFRTRRTLLRWVAAGLVQPCGQDSQGRNLYDLDRLLEVEREMRLRPRFVRRERVTRRAAS